MSFLEGKELVNHLKSIIHEDTQLHKDHFDLSAAQIDRFTIAGALDFGGSEFKPVQTESVELQKKQSADYGWWHLSEGTYQIIMNETLTEITDATALLTPHPHIQKAGVTANTTILQETENTPITMTIHIPSVGCNIKENARVASLYLLSY
ncbi:hypothetical protein [Fodinibius saliphilus]|uniref:hypothetical protein n=1 Tax=Fodinibius saliphilus TaxID=1920650 RepID=UPI00110950BF|nr:hypothetical protein [Fodinibius saliphilus]